MAGMFDGHTLKTGNKPHRPCGATARELAKKWGARNGYRGEIGGWIYDQNGQHVAHGWGQFFWRFGQAIRAWAVSEGIISEDAKL